MFVDAQAQFSNSQAVTASAISTNTYDTGGGLNVLKDIGGSRGQFLVIQVDAAATAAGAATVVFSVESDSTADLATSPTVHYTSAAIGKAALVPGYQIAIPLPSGRTYERHVGVRYTVATGPLTAGAFSAFITNDLQNWTAYANALA